MIKKKTLVFLIVSVLLMQAFIVKTSFNGTTYSNVSGVTAKEVIQSIEEIITSDAVPGTEIIQTNHFPEGDMENTYADGKPTAFGGQGSGNSQANFTYQDEVHTGTYGAYLGAKGTSQHSNYLSRSRSFTIIPERTYMNQSIELELWYNAKSNPDFAFGAEAFFYIWFNTNLGNRYIYYYLSRTSGLPSNGSVAGYMDIRGPTNSWINVERNLTEDVQSIFGGGVDLSQTYCYFMYLVVTSIANPSGENIVLYDDMSVTNGTGFDFFADNGDFEDGDAYPWYNYREGPGSLFTTSLDFTEGSNAANVTIEDPSGVDTISYQSADADIYDMWGAVPQSYYPGKPGDLLFNFDWKYSDNVGEGGTQRSYIWFNAQNQTNSIYLLFYFGTETDTNPSGNSTGSTWANRFMLADGFGIRDTWHSFSLDFYGLLEELGYSNLIPYSLGFYVEGRNTDGCINTLLIDDLQIVTYPAIDPGFEGNLDYIPTMPIQQWSGPNNADYINVTTDAYAGNYAANISAYTGYSNLICYQDTYLPITDNLYFDSYWRLDEITTAGSAFSAIRLEIDGTRFIHYILGYNDNLGMYTNDSNNCYYYVENCNQTGIWNNLFRDLYEDIIDGFGAGTWHLTKIELRSYCLGGTVTTTLFDEINFITDVAGPVLSNFDQTPDPVEYNEAVTISIDAVDNIGIQWIMLYYQIDYGSWVDIPMALNGGHYEAVIPAQVFGTVVHYQIEAQDVNGFIIDSGTPFSYVAYDLTFPILDVESPPLFAILTGDVIFNISSEDVGSGIDYFEITINDVEVYHDSIAPSTFTWITTDYPDGDYVIVFHVVDNVGNGIGGDYTYSIDNIADSPTNVGAIFSGLVSFGLVAVAASTMIYFSERRKKYLK